MSSPKRRGGVKVKVNEPGVIHEELILAVVSEIINKERDKKLAGKTGSGVGERIVREPVTILDYPSVTTLTFSFQNILRIDNLQGFSALTKLQLDNNIIEKIENLSHLTNLTWLDLSFNNIAKIEGLEELTKLTVLTLYNNRIAELEGLGTLRDLEVFSIGNNAIASLSNVMYLRQFKKLRMVHLAGNPIATPGQTGYNPEYKSFVMAHLKYLKFLDYRLVDNASVNAAKEQYQDELLELEEKERLEEAGEAERKVAQEKRARLAAAHLQGVDTLLSDVLNEDPELPRLKLIEVLHVSLPEFTHRFDRLTDPFIEHMIDAYNGKIKEKEKMTIALRNTLEVQERKSLELIQVFESDKKSVMAAVKAGMDSDVLVRRLTELRSELDTLYNSLMELEVCQVDINTDFLREYEKHLKEAFDKSADHIQGYFVALRELEESNHSNVMAATTLQYERYQANELDTAISDEGRHLLQDKDTLLNVVNGSHDAHLFRIDAKEDELTKREADLYAAWVQGAKDEENRRNRVRVSEILGYVARNQTEIDEYLQVE